VGNFPAYVRTREATPEELSARESNSGLTKSEEVRSKFKREFYSSYDVLADHIVDIYGASSQVSSLGQSTVDIVKSCTQRAYPNKPVFSSKDVVNFYFYVIDRFSYACSDLAHNLRSPLAFWLALYSDNLIKKLETLMISDYAMKGLEIAVKGKFIGKALDSISDEDLRLLQFFHRVSEGLRP